jgi:hypothetical protein
MAWHQMRGTPHTGVLGDLYAVRLSRPFGHARHYQGWTEPVDGDIEYIDVGGIKIEVSPGVAHRLSLHGTRAGAKMLYLARLEGITFDLCWTGRGDRHEERRLKNQGGGGIRRRCAYCLTGTHIP